MITKPLRRVAALLLWLLIAALGALGMAHTVSIFDWNMGRIVGRTPLPLGLGNEQGILLVIGASVLLLLGWFFWPFESSWRVRGKESLGEVIIFGLVLGCIGLSLIAYILWPNLFTADVLAFFYLLLVLMTLVMQYPSEESLG